MIELFKMKQINSMQTRQSTFIDLLNTLKNSLDRFFKGSSKSSICLYPILSNK